MTRLSFSSLRVRLLLLVLLAILPAVWLILTTGAEQRRLAAVAAEENALRLARVAAAEQQRSIEGARQLLSALSQLPQVRGGDPAGCNALFGNLLKQYEFYTGFTAAAPDGDVVCSAPPLTRPIKFADRAWYRRLVDTRDFVIGEYQLGRLSGKPTIILAYPVLGTAGDLRAIVTAGLDLAWLNQLAAETQLPPGSTLTLMDRTGTILARFPDPQKWIGKSVPDAPIVRHILGHSGEGTTEAIGLDGISRLYAFTALRFPGMPHGAAAYLSVGFPTDVAFADPKRLLVRNLALLGLVTMLALAAAWVGGDVFFLRRVKGLVTATNRLAAGDLGARTGLSHEQGELGQLARTFDRMAEGLQQREGEQHRAEEALRQSEQKLSLHIQQTPLGVIEWDIDFRVVKWNPAAERIFGLTEAEALGRQAVELIVPPSAREHVDRVWHHLLTQKGGTRSTNENVTEDGQTILCEWYNTPLVTADGKVIGVASLVQDITERRLAEEVVRQAHERYRQLFEDAPTMYVITRNEAGVPIIAECNTLFLSTLGYPRAEVLARPLTDFYTPESVAELGDGGYQRALEGHFAAEERQLVTREGRIVETLLHAVPEMDADGKVSGTRAMFTDITARKRAEEVLAERTRQLEAVRGISEEITRELGLATLLTLVTRRAAELLGVGAGALFLWDEAAQVLVPRARYGQGEWVKELSFRMGEGVVGTVAQRRVGLIVNDYRTSPHAHPRALEETTITAVLAEPLLYQDHLLGVLSVDSRHPGRSFTEEDRRTLSLFAVQAAIAVENAQLYHEALEKTRRLEGLGRTIARVAQTLWLDEVLRAIAEEAATLLRIEGAGFRLLEGDELVVGGKYGLAHHVMLRPSLKVGESLSGLVVQEARPVSVADLREDSAYLPEHRAAALAHGVAAYLGVPLRYRDKIIGVLNVYGKEPRPFHEEDIRILSTFADHAAVAIENARLYKEVRSAAIQLEARVEDRTRELQEAMRRLEEASRRKSEFLANMSHELRTPLNSILGFSELLQGEAFGPLTEKQIRYLGHIYQGGKHLLQLISDILDLSKVEAGKFVLQPAPLPVAATLEDILVIARGLAKKKDQEVEADIAPDLPALRADPVRFKQILFNLLSNAVKFTPEQGRITLVARRASSDRECLGLRITDTGVGIRAEDLPRLFQEFVQLETAKDQRHEGSGLGLALTKRLVELHGGRISAESDGEGKGCSFMVLLPFGGSAEALDARPGGPDP